MKLLAFADPHGNPAAIKSVTEKAKKENPDLILCIGDLTDFGRNLEEIASILNKLKKPILLIHGNHETEEDIKQLAKKHKYIINLHKGLYEHEGFLFFGYGGEGFHRTDEKFERIAKQVEETLPENKKLILLFHEPPYNTKLDKMPHAHVGSKSYREFIERVEPLLVLTGHIHECEGNQDRIKNTLMIYPQASGMIIEI